MTQSRASFALALAAALAVATSARAQHDAGFGATGRAEQSVPTGAGADPTAAATTVEAGASGRALETADELMLEVPGAQAWSTGAYGAYTALSLRGAGAEHTTVLLGDLPLATEGEAFDLSLVPVALIDRVEVYRGGAPIGLGTGGIGGVVRVVPRSEPRSMGEAAIGVGSFGLVHGRVATAVVGDATSWTAAAGAVRSDGDFPFTYDATELVPGDEREARRQNAHADEGHGLVHLRAPVAGTTVEAALLGIGRTGGVPGPAVQTSRATRSLSRVAALASVASGRAPFATRGAVGVSYGRDALSDPFGEIGFGRARITDDRTVRAHALGSTELEVLPWLAASAVLAGGYETREPRDVLAPAPIDDSHRWSGSVAAEARVHGRVAGARVEVRPSVRARVARSVLHEIAAGREGERASATTSAPGARLGAVVSPAPGLAVAGSIAYETRFPTFLELFGDRAFLLGDTRLREERAITADLGVLARGTEGLVHGSVEARGFVLLAEDLIRYRRTAQSQALPENVARARTMGVELGARGDIGRHVGLAAALTLLRAEDRALDRALPLRPGIQAYARPEARLFALGPLSRVRVFGEVTYVGATFADPHNLIVVDARLLLGAGIAAEVLDGGLAFALTATDIGDERPTDVLGFPLPGRAFELTVTGRTEAW